MFKRIILVMLCIIAFVAAGCGGQQDNDRKAKNEIVIAMGKYMIGGGYDPTTGFGMWSADPIHSALFTHNEKNELVKDLATHMDVSPDGLIYTVTIRDDVKFSDGQPLTAEAVEFTYNTARKAGGSVDLSFLKSVKALDKTHVVFTLNKAFSILPETMATLGIVAPHAYGPDYGSRPLGSGPWKVVHFEKEQQLILEPNEYYYGAKPKLNKVTVINVSDEAALAAAKSGQVDVVFITPEFLTKDVKGMKAVNYPTIDGFAINMPMERETQSNGMLVGNNVTSDKAIREALNIGISRKNIINNALGGFGEPAFTFSKYVSWSNQEMNEEDGQVEKAKEILEQAGWKDTDGDGIREKDGVKAEFVINGRSNDIQRYNIAVAFAEEAKALGINVIAKSAAWSEARKIARHEPTVWAFGDYSPMTIFSYYHGSQIGVNIINNPAMYNNPIVNDYIEKALAASSQEEAIEFFKKAQWDGSKGMKADIPYIWIANADINYLVNENLDLGHIRVGERGQGMGIVYNMNEWQWK